MASKGSPWTEQKEGNSKLKQESRHEGACNISRSGGSSVLLESTIYVSREGLMLRDEAVYGKKQSLCEAS